LGFQTPLFPVHGPVAHGTRGLPHSSLGSTEARVRAPTGESRSTCTDLNDGSVQGGKLSTFMASLNWYSRPPLKRMSEVGTGRVCGTADDGHQVVGQLRLGVNF
jgi:hypothetical protein